MSLFVSVWEKVSMPVLPSGTIALLFTDVEDFTRHCAENEAEALAALRRHDALLRDVIEARGGVVFKTVGDAFHAAFALPGDALGAAVEIQKRLPAESTESAERVLRVRMALHTGAPESRDGDYFGLSVNTVARLRDLGHGGQVLTSQAFYETAHTVTDPEITFRSLHAWHLKGIPHPETIFQVAGPTLPDDFPPLRAISESAGNLPVLLSSFVGRAQSLAQIAPQIEQHKLLTLRGAGGCGKTRLALEAAGSLESGFPGGIWLVRLEGIDDGSRIAPEAVRVLRLFQPPDQTAEETLIERLRERPTLLLLDNCEHLPQDCARFAHLLLTSCPDLRILATSREPLGMPGEFVHDVPPLSFPQTGRTFPHGGRTPTLAALQASEAVQLFSARAGASGGFALTRQNAASVARICCALDGIPLALELAARWVGVLSLGEIAGDLAALVNHPHVYGDTGETGETGEMESVPARQRTMRAAVDWSYQRLSPTQQAFFLNLAVFVGGFTLEAARAVASEVAGSAPGTLRLLKSLVDRSLVFFDEEAKPEARYRLLEPVREVALAKLTNKGADTEAEARAREQHRRWFFDYALRAEPELRGADSVLWLDRLEADHENLRAVLKGTSDPALHLRLAVALYRFWFIRHYLTEGSAWLEAAVKPALALDLKVSGLNAAGILAYERRAYGSAERLFQEALSAYQSLDDPAGIAKCVNNLGLIAERSGQYAEAQRLFEQSLTIYRRLNDAAHAASVLGNLGMVAYGRADYEAACLRFQESIALHRKSESLYDLAVALHNLGMTLADKGDLLAALGHHQESLGLRVSLKHEQGIIDSLFLIAFSQCTLGQDKRAVTAFSAGENAMRLLGSEVLSQSARDRYDGNIARLRVAMDADTFRECWDEGQRLLPRDIAEGRY